MPADAPFNRAFMTRRGLFSRPRGSPRKIVAPAIAPRRTVCAVLMGQAGQTLASEVSMEV